MEYPVVFLNPEPFYYSQGVVVAALHEDIPLVQHPNDLAGALAVHVGGYLGGAFLTVARTTKRSFPPK